MQNLINDAKNLISLDKNCDINKVKIWIVASSQDAAIKQTAENLRQYFSGLGADVDANISVKNMRMKYETRIIQEKILAADVVLMLAATPGVSAKAIDICHKLKGKSEGFGKILVYIPTEFSAGSIGRLLAIYKANTHFINKIEFVEPLENNKNFYSNCLGDVIALQGQKTMEQKMNKKIKPTIAIVTALPIEFASAMAIVEDYEQIQIREEGKAFLKLALGKVAASCGNQHSVVIGMSGVGNNLATQLATNLLEKYPSIEIVLMVGIAGGVPDIKNPKAHVRLGDVVVSGREGVIQFDLGKYKDGQFERIQSPRPPSSTWLLACEADTTLIKNTQKKYWQYIDELCKSMHVNRPAKGPLREEPWLEGEKSLSHPKDPSRTSKRPKLFIGAIGSSNSVIKDKKYRDKLKNEYKVMAVEMEGSGIADATWKAEKGYLIIRGICDYSNEDKNKDWQEYAAIVAAAFTKYLIESMPVTVPST
ncbi:MAG: phosphorylase [Burkholderiales bacterium]|nr:phosphorylase [Burkholderiales bacterium]